MTTAAQVIETFLKYRGTVEDPAGSNRTLFGERYGWNGVAWCNISLSEVGKEASGSYDLLGKFAWTPACANWYAARGRWGTTPKPGAVVFFDWSGFKSREGIDHVGLVIDVLPDGRIRTIEGNAAIAGKPDGVWVHDRSTALVVGYGYPAYTTSKPSQPASAVPPLPAKPAPQPTFRPYQKVAAGSRTVRVLDAGDDVKVLQRAVGAVADGQFGARTKNAVQAYQKARGLAADGVAGPMVWAWVLNKGKGHTTPKGVHVPPFPGTTRRGSTGAAVKALQARLVTRGWKGIVVDGKFGQKTEDAVLAFQKEKGLTRDGVVGVDTWGALWRSPVT